MSRSFLTEKEVTAMVNEDNIDDASDPEEDDNVVTYDSDTEYHREIESDSSSRSSSPDQQHASTSNIAVIARSGREYTTAPPRQVRRSVQNIVSFHEGLTNEGLTSNASESFKKFITPEIVNIIVHHTNEEASIRNLKLTNTEELYAFIGILILMGANNDSELPIDDLWGKVLGKNIYTATMSRIRFGELLSLIRFDDKQTRTERRKQDKFCPIREVFYKIDELFVKYYIPRCYRMYTRYILKMEVYAGKDERPAEERTAKAVVRRLVKPLEGTGRNVTTDRYYTSIELAEELYNDDKLTLVGTLKSNRKHIPEELKKTQGRELYSSRFLFTDPKTGKAPVTLVSYITRLKPTKNLLLLSTQHNDRKVDESTEKKKTDVNLYYNETKGGIDSIDQMTRHHSVKRGTRRWPLSIFFTLIDIACLNGGTIFMKNNPDWNKKKHNVRRLCMLELGQQLVRPVVEERAKNTIGLQKPIISAIESVLGKTLPSTSVVVPSGSVQVYLNMIRCVQMCIDAEGEPLSISPMKNDVLNLLNQIGTMAAYRSVDQPSTSTAELEANDVDELLL
ncbi:hypothetical protein ANN_19261 [Periplaneta americana]|uniref:PiggyBac transposable element-derived protein domain-containing protein n=1 Tax=Periplaneta americana TaxID=6978 RepID=A0ABQ8SA11_PERAM|nr:hypothetical protein ANN_19261 [Periplaneta americana]